MRITLDYFLLKELLCFICCQSLIWGIFLFPGRWMAAGSSQSLKHQFSSQLSLFPSSLVCLGSGCSCRGQVYYAHKWGWQNKEPLRTRMMKVLKEIINGCTSQAPEPAVETTLEMDRFCLRKKKNLAFGLDPSSTVRTGKKIPGAVCFCSY